MTDFHESWERLYKTMKISFVTKMPVEATMVFEHLFEEELWLDESEKAALLKNCISAWMFIDDEPAGEIYGVGHADLDEEIPDVDPNDKDYCYLYSLAILPKYQGKGLAKILMAYWMGMVGDKYKVIDAHCTAEKITPVMKVFGAKFFWTHLDWFDSGREATYCKIYL